MQYFEHVLNEEEGGNHKFLEALIGKAKVFEKGKKYEDCLEVLSEITVCHPTFTSALIEKAKIHIQNSEWDQAMEMIANVTVKDKQNVEAIRLQIFYFMARENDIETVQERFPDLVNALRKREGKNPDLFYNIARLFSRYCGRKPEIISLTQNLLDIAICAQPENAAYHCEIALQQSMVGDFETAYQTYQKASTFDDQYLAPLFGMIYCRIKQELIDDAQQQLEFLAEINENQVKGSEQCFLEAIIEWKKKGNKSEAIRMLDQSLNAHIQ